VFNKPRKIPELPDRLSYKDFDLRFLYRNTILESRAAIEFRLMLAEELIKLMRVFKLFGKKDAGRR
jgi:hypothetical protein